MSTSEATQCNSNSRLADRWTHNTSTSKGGREGKVMDQTTWRCTCLVQLLALECNMLSEVWNGSLLVCMS